MPEDYKGCLHRVTHLEADYLAKVYDLCDHSGIKYHHCNDSRKCTATPGMPDLILVGPRRIIFREIKASLNDRVRAEQSEWLWMLKAAGQDARVWTSEDLLYGRVAHELSELAYPEAA
jgi:hypothetical protein